MTATPVKNRWLVVLGAVLIQLCLGAIYAWSVFTPSLKAAGWSSVQTQAVFAVGLLCFALSMVWSGKRLASWGPRKLTLLSGAVLGGGYALAGLIGGTEFWSFFLFMGIVGGVGIGLGYVVPISVCMRWFPDQKGFITGLAVAGFGFGAMAWVKLAGSWGHLIASLGLTATLVVYGAAFTALITLGAVWMVYPADGWLPEGYVPPESEANAAGADCALSPAAMLKTREFAYIFLTFAFCAGAGLMSIGLMKLYPMEALQASGLSAAEASAISGTAMAVFFSLANGIGRIAWGAISDRLGRKTSIVVMAGTQGVFVMGFPFVAGNEYVLYLAAACIGFNFGGAFSLFPTITADTFGPTCIGQNYPYVFLSYGVGGIFGPILGGMLGDMGNFPMAFTICGVLCLLGATLTSRVRPVVDLSGGSRNG